MSDSPHRVKGWYCCGCNAGHRRQTVQIGLKVGTVVVVPPGTDIRAE